MEAIPIHRHSGAGEGCAVTTDEAIEAAEAAAREWRDTIAAMLAAGIRVQEALSQLSAVMAIEKAKADA